MGHLWAQFLGPYQRQPISLPGSAVASPRARILREISFQAATHCREAGERQHGEHSPAKGLDGGAQVQLWMLRLTQQWCTVTVTCTRDSLPYVTEKPTALEG